jgi:integrase
MFHHTQSHNRGAAWPVAWIQYVADNCRDQGVLALADLDLDGVPTPRQRQVPVAMLDYLRLVYFTREDSRDAGFIDTEFYGIRYHTRTGLIDLTCISQRWLRDLVWDWMDARLIDGKHRSRNSFEVARRGCMELSAYLQAQTPGGGHDPTEIIPAHIIDFVADQRHRAEHGLAPLARFYRDRRKVPVVRKESLARILNGARQVLRAALETGRAEQIGLSRAVVVALPTSKVKGGRRRPFSDEVAQALADEHNLAGLEELDLEDRGLRDIWETLIATGRRSGEVREVRLECISRLGGLPMFWHDQSKVGNYDQAIRIPERIYHRIQERQDKTITRFIGLHGRQPTGIERHAMALFPRRSTNRDLRLSISPGWFNELFNTWIDGLDIGHWVPHQARHTLATNLLRNGADLTHVKRYLGQVSERMAEHYVHLANTDPRLEDALNAVWVAGPGSASPGVVLSGGQPMTRQEAEAMAIDMSRRSTPAEGGFCTFQPVVRGEACPWNMDCHNCDKFVMSGADLLYWRRKAEQWRMLAERAPDSATADYLHEAFEPTARAITGLEKALAAVGLLNDALALDLRRPQDYYGRVWSLSFRASTLADGPSADEADTGPDA